MALTGSVAAGRSIAARAGQNLKPSSMELGGSDAFIVLEDADLEHTIKWAVWGRMYNTGQTCCAAKRFIVVEKLADKFLEKFQAALGALKAGDPLDEKTTLGPLSTESALVDLLKQIDVAVAHGAKVLMGGKRIDRPGSFMQPTILTDVKPDNPAFRDEFFGPVAMFFRVKDEDAAIALANDSDFGLGGSVFTKDLARGKRVASRVDTGMMFINNISWSDAELPFGGIKNSGYGRELGDMGIQEFVNKKLVRYVSAEAPRVRRFERPALKLSGDRDEAFGPSQTFIDCRDIRSRFPIKEFETRSWSSHVRQCRRFEGNTAARTARGSGAVGRSKADQTRREAAHAGRRRKCHQVGRCRIQGCRLHRRPKELVSDADVVLAVQPPAMDVVDAMQEGAILVSFIYANSEPRWCRICWTGRSPALPWRRVPRITRAQSMDALSSQSALAGYYAVQLGATNLGRVLPKITTAAGAIGPAKVLVMGLGVAGLEALATAHRLGAVTEGYDVRPETQEQALSLGAKFVETGVDARGKGGYARELTAEEKAKVAAVLTKHIQAADLIITTAAIPGRASPKLISKEQVAGMKAGAVIVDLSAEGGGNCEDTQPGETVQIGQVTIVAPLNVPSLLGEDASELYSKNQYNLLALMMKDNIVKIDWDDEVLAKTVLTHAGEMKNEAPKPSVDRASGDNPRPKPAAKVA